MNDWTHAACAGDPDAMFTDRPDEIAYNRRVCARCPIRTGCLDYALDTGEAYGIWGGTTPAERSAMSAGRHGEVRPHVVAQVRDGVQKFRALNTAERVQLWNEHTRTGQTPNRFARRYGLSGTTLRAVRAAADRHRHHHDLAA